MAILWGSYSRWEGMQIYLLLLLLAQRQTETEKERVCQRNDATSYSSNVLACSCRRCDSEIQEPIHTSQLRPINSTTTLMSPPKVCSVPMMLRAQSAVPGGRREMNCLLAPGGDELVHISISILVRYCLIRLIGTKLVRNWYAAN